MNCRVIVHEVLEISHVAEEILRHLRGRLQRPCWRKGWPTNGILKGINRGHRGRWWRMAGQVCRHKEEKEDANERKYRKEIGIQADEGVDDEE